jgi:iron complex transport system ATP-binding protein
MNEKRLAYGIYGLGVRFRGTGESSFRLSDISFEVEEGDFIALLGPNGSGKSTLMKAISGVMPWRTVHIDGQVRAQGEDLLKVSSERRACRLSYVATDLSVEFPLTAFEAVLMGRSNALGSLLDRGSDIDSQRVEWAMLECQCWGLRSRDVRSLSGGERQLVVLARALAYGAKNLLIDETLSRMDLHHQARIGELLVRLCSEKKYTVVLVSHDWNLAMEWADRCVLLNRGQVVAQGPCSEVVHEKALAALYPEAPLAIDRNPLSGRPRITLQRKL